MTTATNTSTSRCDINVTPLIDILLVLLIIFMIISPVTPRGLPTSLPQDSPSRPIHEDSAIVLQILDDHSLRLNTQPIELQNLTSEISQIYATRATKVLFLQASQNLEYREVARVLDLIRGSNPSIQVGLAKQQP